MDNTDKTLLGIAIVIILISTAGLVGFWFGQNTIKRNEIWNGLVKWCENEDNNCCDFCYGNALQKNPDDYFVFET